MSCFLCVDTSQRAVIQKFGQFSHIGGPGFNFICWPICTASMVSIKVRQIDVRTETKTKDNVTLRVTTAVQYSVDQEKVDQYFFKESKEKMADAIKDSVASSMECYGVKVNKALVVDMQPDASVLAAMNQINAARRQREAAIEKAEAEKVMAVKSAEADAESKHLSGLGTAKMRQAITDGFKGSIESMRQSCGLEPKEVVHMMLVTQYLDVLKEFAVSGKATLVVPHGASAVQDIETQVRNGFMQSSMMNQMN